MNQIFYQQFEDYPKKENTQLYIIGCKIGCFLCNLLIFSIYCGERGSEELPT